jgi:GT2 family glycosyltransferase/glycosyltransferase involved in cell wall biosynthesis
VISEQAGPQRGWGRKAVEKLLPNGSAARAVLRLGRQVGRDGRSYVPRFRSVWQLANLPGARHVDYQEWLNRVRVSPSEIVRQIERSFDDSNPATNSTIVEVIVLPAAGTDSKAAPARTLDSLRSQTSASWQAIFLSGAGSDLPDANDSRVRVVELAGRYALELAADRSLLGEANALVVIVEAGDVLEPDFVFEVTARAWDDPHAVILHWDDDVFGPDDLLTNPRFRPSWSPDILLGANYLGRSFAVRRSALQDSGGFTAEFGDAAWWDLLLRLDLTERKVVRIPRVLSHMTRRLAESQDLAIRTVSDHLKRLGRSATVSPASAGLRVVWQLDELPHVTVIIPTRHNTELLSRCLPSLAATNYPSFDVQIVDNGERTPESEDWYQTHAFGLDLDVTWWDKPFNYSEVNNVAARSARGEILLFLNDDTELVDPEWMSEMVGWASQPEIGLVGVQLLDGDGLIQHGGVLIGVNGFADHLFIGMAPHSETLLGPTDWYRNALSVTAACVAVRRELFEKIGGFDERFILCGSDVVLGLDAHFLGLRNVITPFVEVRHLESATRGSTVPLADFHASYWRYQKYFRGGDPYFSAALSRTTGAPMLSMADEPGPMPTVGSVIGRDFTVFRQTSDEAEANWLASICRADDALVDSVEDLHRETSGWADVESINWFFPDIDSPFYGGINTALRMADHLARTRGVTQRFVIMANPNEEFFRSAIAAAFPALADCEMVFIEGPLDETLDDVPYADVSIATLWVTAYSVARFSNTRRKFYLIQDFEPQFYPAGTKYALTEEGYRLGLYGLCNTQRLLGIYEDEYRGTGGAFMPAVDQSVFHARDRAPLDGDGPTTVFVYARPGHWRNCWELAALALGEVKARFGDDVRIITAGSWARPDDLGGGIEHLGLLDYRDTGELYRMADVGVALTVSAHPSYLPLELMACGVPVVAFDNPAGDWILAHGENSLRCRRTVDGLAGAISRLVADPDERVRMGRNAEQTITDRFSDWEAAFSGVYDILADPEGWTGPAAGSTFP